LKYDHVEDKVNCLENECAWYDVDAGECGVLSVAKTLRYAYEDSNSQEGKELRFKKWLEQEDGLTLNDVALQARKENLPIERVSKILRQHLHL
jgi:hypothetical protein